MPRSDYDRAPQLVRLCSLEPVSRQLPRPHAAATEAHAPQSLCSATREATTKRSLCTTPGEQLPLAATKEKTQQ